MKILHLSEIPQAFYDKLGYPSESKCGDFVQISTAEADAYYDAALECFKCVDEATEYVIERGLLGTLGVPEYMHSLVAKSYKNYTQHPHMLGRFDFAGGLQQIPIKLLEFNADTPFGIFETSAVQYALAKYHGLEPDTKQFNTLFEQLVEFFSHLKKERPERNILFTNVADGEDDLNTRMLHEACGEIFPYTHTLYRHWSSVAVAEDYHICVAEQFDATKDMWRVINFDTIVKMVPWDWLFAEDSAFAKLIAEAMLAQPDTVVCNPAYAAAYQSKALMRYMWQLFPHSPYLLFTHDTKPDVPHMPYVRKPVYGREGDNIYMYTGTGSVETSGAYGDDAMIYQELAQMVWHEGYCYQAGVYVSMEEPCALNFRRSKTAIIVTDDEICGHIID